MRKKMKEIDQVIDDAANDASDKAIQYLNQANNPRQDKPDTPVNTAYFSHKFIGLNEKAKSALAKAYLIRREPFTDHRWVDCYADWLTATGNKYHDKHDGLKDFKTMSAYYWTRINAGKGDFIKKDYSHIKDMLRENIRRKTDADYAR